MTTESLMAEPRLKGRIAKSVLAGISVFVVVGVYVLVSSIDLGLWTSLGPGPGMFPFAMGVLLVAMSVVWLFQELRNPSETPGGVDGRLVIAVVVSLAVLAAVLDLLGFQLSMFAFLLYHLKVRGRRGWLSSLIIALAGTVGAFYAFNYGLNVSLPTAGIPLLNSIGL
ncbi:tripartite tricarboxylate transporter TctB family protein [Paenarthrobacter sp. CC6]|uniref:tripartite tricarboxylate transporter TctB family protein n=1 Tax=Paenarthrobacter sp. CC6 TaxID=3029184 RepID=UPI00339C30E6